MYPLGCESPLFPDERGIVMSGVGARAKWPPPLHTYVLPKSGFKLGYYEELPKPLGSFGVHLRALQPPSCAFFQGRPYGPLAPQNVKLYSILKIIIFIALIE